MDYYEDSLKLHEKHGGKLGIVSKVPLKTRLDLSLAYTPGVAGVSEAIAKNPDDVFRYTIKKNTVAIVSDGSSVLGLGNVGAEAAIPVMEGKAILLKEFAGIDAFPICIKSQEAEDIISVTKNIAPVFGGINLEDISAPKCFQVEEELRGIGIPVMHDDQHGTAIVVLAGLLNACKATGKEFGDLQVVISGAGAAGIAVAKMLLGLGEGKTSSNREKVKEVILVDSKGIVVQGRSDLNETKAEMAIYTNKEGKKGGIADALEKADVFIGLSTGGIVSRQMVERMNSDAVVFALANPTPEIMPEEAKAGGARVIATGRSDYPNQVNNALSFPGVFRGALDSRAKKMNGEMYLAAAHALASCVAKPTESEIVPTAFDRNIVPRIAQAVAKAARESGVA